MSLNKNRELREIAKIRCRELRKDSTPAEKKLWHEIRNRKLSGWKFLRQHPIFYDLNGKESFFIVDFYCHEKKLIIELDGEIHKRQLIQDAERTDILEKLGLNVIRFRNEEVETDIKKVLRRIVNELKNNSSPKPSR